MRKSIKKPLTQHGYNRLLKDLSTLVAFDINERLETAIDRKWQGLVFNEDKNGNGTNKQSHSNGSKPTPAETIAGRWYRQAGATGQGDSNG